jgi:hypothetical protein
MAALALFLSALLAVTSAQSCTFTAKDAATRTAYQYDLSGLTHAAGMADYSYGPDAYGNTFYINFCGDTTVGCTSQAVCQRARNNYYYGCGASAKQTFMKTNLTGQTLGTGVMLLYSGGDACSDGPLRMTLIYVSCNPNASPGWFYDAYEGNCAYTLKMWSKYGCGTTVPYVPESSSSSHKGGGGGSGIGVGGILLILLVVCVVVYFAAGAVYQWKFKEPTTAREYVIHNEFWCGIPLLVKDGVMFIAHGCNRDYSPV